MAKTIELNCKKCGKVFEKQKAEYDRQIKEGRDKDKFFCSQSCATKWQNVECGKYARTLVKFCPYCDSLFTTKEDKHEREYCSRSCASKDNVTEFRRRRAREAGEKHKDNLASIHELLRVRESEKYENLKQWFDDNNINYKFEYPLNDYVFDLYLKDKNTLVEFDGEYHQEKKQRKIDKRKNKLALQKGFKVKRIDVDGGAKIPIELIKNVITGPN